MPKIRSKDVKFTRNIMIISSSNNNNNNNNRRTCTSLTEVCDVLYPIYALLDYVGIVCVTRGSCSQKLGFKKCTKWV